MKKMNTMMFTLMLTVAVALSQAALASQDGEMMMKKKGKSEKAAAAPATDADIQKCISEKFAKSKTITNGAATVANGEATITGEAKNGGAKGGGVQSAKACGAKKVVNNLTIAETAKGAAKSSDKKKAEPAKK